MSNDTAILRKLLTNTKIFIPLAISGLFLALFAGSVAQFLVVSPTQVRIAGFTIQIVSSIILSALNWRLVFLRSHSALAETAQNIQALQVQDESVAAQVEQLLAQRASRENSAGLHQDEQGGAV